MLAEVSVAAQHCACFLNSYLELLHWESLKLLHDFVLLFSPFPPSFAPFFQNLFLPKSHI